MSGRQTNESQSAHTGALQFRLSTTTLLLVSYPLLWPYGIRLTLPGGEIATGPDRLGRVLPQGQVGQSGPSAIGMNRIHLC